MAFATEGSHLVPCVNFQLQNPSLSSTGGSPCWRALKTTQAKTFAAGGCLCA